MINRLDTDMGCTLRLKFHYTLKNLMVCPQCQIIENNGEKNGTF